MNLKIRQARVDTFMLPDSAMLIYGLFLMLLGLVTERDNVAVPLIMAGGVLAMASWLV